MYRVTPTADIMFQKVAIVKQILQDNGIEVSKASLELLDTYPLQVRYRDPQDSLERAAKFINKLLELYDYSTVFGRGACPFCRKYDDACTKCAYARNKGYCKEYGSLYTKVKDIFIPLLYKASKWESRMLKQNRSYMWNL